MGHKLDQLLRHRKFFITYAIVTFFAIPWGAYVIPDNEIKGLLITLSQLNVSIAIGVGAITVALEVSKEEKVGLVKDVLLILVISILTFIIAHVEILIVQRLYFAVSGLIILSLITGVSKVVLSEETNKTYETEEIKGLKKTKGTKNQKKKKRKKR
ncbi:hypothetical protein [Rummeliibacillus sp. TYF-LIM-RU47]|uniref:hypothetical protein n=1 Tax=Rummeliibacillus sp. TYF-LIM-RU47 TaxID=2608406 RepID=UPI00123C10CE|nr:hypothetical protein [Rummeliibacillus sp. TYF-LIM-RU47]